MSKFFQGTQQTHAHKNPTKQRQSKQTSRVYSIYKRIIRWCQLCLLFFILSSFYFLTICTNLDFRLRLRLRHRQSNTSPPTWVVIRKSNTASPLTSDKALAVTEPLRRPTRFPDIHMSLPRLPARRHLRQRPTLPPDFGDLLPLPLPLKDTRFVHNLDLPPSVPPPMPHLLFWSS